MDATVIRRPLSDAAATDLGCVVAWLPKQDPDGRAIVWKVEVVRRLMFLRWLVEHGRVSDR